MAGATVLKGFMGFGANSRIHTANILRLSEDLPVTVMIIDRSDRIDGFLEPLKEMITEGLVATWPVHIEKYTHSK